MNPRLTRSDWEAVLEAALSIARDWERKPDPGIEGFPSLGGRPDEDRTTLLKRHIELEIQTLEALYALRDRAEPPIEMPVEIQGILRRLLWE